jgi:hypothetical protein
LGTEQLVTASVAMPPPALRCRPALKRAAVSNPHVPHTFEVLAVQRFLLTGWAFCGLTLLAGCGEQATTVDPSAPTGTVILTIQLPDQEARVVKVANVAEGDTLESVMRSVEEVPIEITGSGSTAFVKSIDGLATGSSEGWTFRVDGEFAEQGIGATHLNPPTEVTWTFGEYE